MKNDVVALGELLVDFAPVGKNEHGWPMLQALPGGAPCNMLASCARFGLKTSFIGAVGKDHFGALLQSSLDKFGIGLEGVTELDKVFTTLAFVFLREKGERDFAFSRKPGADTCLVLSEQHRNLIKSCRVFHFGSLSLTDEPAASSTKEAVELARSNNVWVNFDPNYRAPLWTSAEKAREAMRWGTEKADSIKIGLDELLFMYDCEEEANAVARLFAETPLELVFVTNGAEETHFYTKKVKGTLAPFLREDTVDTTGAGDIFTGAVIGQLLQHNDDLFRVCSELNSEELTNIVRRANATAALSTTRYGGISSVPTLAEVEALLNVSED